MEPAAVSGAVPAPKSFPRLRDRLVLGGAGLEVSPVCCGITADPATYGAAFDAGINFFFVSTDMHWPLYEGARRGLELLLARGNGIRDEIVVAATCYPTQPEFNTTPFFELVDAVKGLGHIDVAVAGGVYARDWELRRPIYGAHRDEGTAGCRAVGASFHDRTAVPPAVLAGEVDVAFIRYNPLHLGARREVFPHLPAGDRPLLFNFKSAVGWRPEDRYLAAGHDDLWLPTIPDYYRFALSPPEMDGLLCALDAPAQVEALAEALEAGPLDEGDQNHLIALSRLELL